MIQTYGSLSFSKILIIISVVACDPNCEYCANAGEGKCDPGRCRENYTYSHQQCTGNSCLTNIFQFLHF